MGLENYTLYQEYKTLNPEQQHFVRRALSSVFDVSAMNRRNERAAAHNPTFRTQQYMLADASANNDFIQLGIKSQRGVEFMDDYLSLAEEAGRWSVHDLSFAFIQELITRHESHAHTDEADRDTIVGELIGEGESVDGVQRAAEQSLELYAQDLRDTLAALQRLFPDIYKNIVSQLPEMRRLARESLKKLAEQYPDIVDYPVPRKGKPRLH